MRNKDSYRVGFTLIELLVVVLIIGVLAGIALPQYQKAVERTKAMQGITLAKSLGEAGNRHRLASGEYPSSFDVLDMEVRWSGNESALGSRYISDVRSTEDWSCQLVFNETLPQYGVVLTRLKGKHKGAGLMYFWQDPKMPMEQVLCMERFQGEGIYYGGSDGEFCQGILHGNYVGGTYNRYYTLP